MKEPFTSPAVGIEPQVYNKPQSPIDLKQLQAFHDLQANQTFLINSDLEIDADAESILLDSIDAMQEQIRKDFDENPMD
ncbi:MAG: hypothetical protein GY694_18695, partial [Gammaproteobacteria bacterium]|nr:hypothetical protein [Gammaproteobacteria bacterium]